VTGVTMQDMQNVAAELRAALAEHDDICARYGKACIAHERAFLRAHATSPAFHPDRKVREHEVAAKEAAFPEWETMFALEYRLKALKERMHSLRQVLSAFQTQARTERELAS
jgi:hypothetical protein